MLKRLRLKFVCITMVIVTVMLCVIFGTVLTMTASNLEQQSIQMLRTVASEPMPFGRPGERPEQVRLPYFTLGINKNGNVSVIGGDSFDLSDQAFLDDILKSATSAQETVGVLSRYDLRFYRTTDPMGQRIVFTDITSERQTMRALALTCLAIGAASFALLLGVSFLLARWAVKPVERAWQEQRQFVADASHELKTPLTVILTNAELLQQQPNGDRFVNSIHAMAVQMRGLVESLLELARVDNGAVKASFSDLDLGETVRDAILPFEAVFFEGEKRLTSHITPGIMVRGSAHHLQQVVEILLDNANKYAFADTEVEIALQKSGTRECMLCVTSRGEKIDPQDLRNIFKRFYRVDKVRTMSSSYGLGLSIAQSIVRDHGGKIWAESTDGKNSFFVRLPKKG